MDPIIDSNQTQLPHKELKSPNTVSLIKCLLMDALGYLSYSVPLLGELGDLIWAPISAIVFYKTFGGWKGKMGAGFNFLEEIIPGIDFIPSFTLMYFWQKLSNRHKQTS